MTKRSLRKRMPASRCRTCGSSSIAGSFEGHPYCAECLLPYATRVTHSGEEFVQIAEDLVSVAEAYDMRAARTPVRAAHEYSKMMQDLLQAAQGVAPGFVANALSAKAATLPLGDELLAEAVLDALDDDLWGLGEWLDERLALHCMAVAGDTPEASLYDVLGKLFGRRGIRDVTNQMARAALLGERLSLMDLRKEPFRGRLQALNGVVWAHGLVRMAHLSSSIEYGHPPADPFTPEERSLYLRVVPEKVRRTRRAFFLLSGDADFIKDWNDRAERLIALWLLHPVTDRLKTYMGMLHSAYIDGRHAEAVVLSRAILERAVADSCAALGVVGDDRMNARLNALEMGKKVLSPPAAAKARAVWQRGNKVIHQDPEFVRDSFETLECLLTVLSELRQYLDPADQDEAEWIDETE